MRAAFCRPLNVLCIVSVLLFSTGINSQNEQLALDYFNSGEFEKALIFYNKLYENNKGNSNYFLKIVEIHQQLEQFDIAESLLMQQLKININPQYLVELGYNYH